MNSEKLRGPARAIFQNPNFQSLCELGKNWKYNIKPRSKSPNFESIDKLAVTFHCWKKDGEFTQGWSHFKLDRINAIYIQFPPISRICDVSKSPAKTPTLYLQILLMQIPTQTDNHNLSTEKVLQLKKVHSIKQWVWSAKTINSTFYSK